MRRLGRFIVVEGIDGSGKSSFAKALANRPRCLLTTEPWTSAPGKKARELMQTGGATDADLLQLFAEDREHHLDNQILPALVSGDDVVCDRYLLSTLAYQGPRLGRKAVLDANKLALVPHITVFLRVDPALAYQRILARNIPVAPHETLPSLTSLADAYEEEIGRMDADVLGRLIVIENGGTLEEALQRAGEYLR